MVNALTFTAYPNRSARLVHTKNQAATSVLGCSTSTSCPSLHLRRCTSPWLYWGGVCILFSYSLVPIAASAKRHVHSVPKIPLQPHWHFGKEPPTSIKPMLVVMARRGPDHSATVTASWNETDSHANTYLIKNLRNHKGLKAQRRDWRCPRTTFYRPAGFRRAYIFG